MPSVLDNGGYVGISGEYDVGGMWGLTSSSDGIVRNGLILYLDAANKNSYPGTGSTWFDISGSGNHMTLVNSPTFSTNVLRFNGSNQYGTIAALNYSATNFTIIGMSRYSGATRGRVITSISNNWLFGHWGSGSEEYFAGGWIFEGTANDTNWRIYAAVENHSSDQRTFYVNDVVKALNSTAGANGFNGLSVGRWGGGGGTEYSTCEVSVILVYNRLLNTTELTRNYNALRGRFSI